MALLESILIKNDLHQLLAILPHLVVVVELVVVLRCAIKDALVMVDTSGTMISVFMKKNVST